MTPQAEFRDTAPDLSTDTAPCRVRDARKGARHDRCTDHDKEASQPEPHGSQARHSGWSE